MSETAKRLDSTPESYAPKDKPEIIRMAEALCAEKVIETYVIEGVEFTLVEKQRTLYAGSYVCAPDLETEPDVEASWHFYHDNKGRIADSLTPNCMICISINYAVPDLPCAMVHGQETSSPHQPEGIHVLESPPSLFLRVMSSSDTWKLAKQRIGEDDPQWHMAPLFFLIRAIFCNETYGFEFISDPNHEMEYYYDDGTKGVAVPVRRIAAKAERR